MYYQEIHEEAKYYSEHKTLHRQDGHSINTLFQAACNYLMYSDFNESYFRIYYLVEGIYHDYHDRLTNDNPYKMPIFRGVSKSLLALYHHIQHNTEITEPHDKQLLLACCINLNRVMHTGAQLSENDVKESQISQFSDVYEAYSNKFPMRIEVNDAMKGLKKMNRFIIICDYLIEKYHLKYPPRIPRHDDFCKLVHVLDQDCSLSSLTLYFDRMDTAKFDKVSVYSPWNVCYYKNIRDQLRFLSESTLQKQFNQFRTHLLKISKKCKDDTSEAAVYRTLEKQLKH